MNKPTLYLLGLMTVMAAAYLLYLAASWNQYQKDREARIATVDQLLDRISNAKEAAKPTVIVRPESD